MSEPEIVEPVHKGIDLTFEGTPWYRKSYSGRIEERPARIEDLIAEGATPPSGYVYDSEYFDAPNVWKASNPNYQADLDMYIMRRTVENVTAYCEINPSAFDTAQMADILSEQDLSYSDFIRVSGSDVQMTLDAAWYLFEIDCQDTPKKSRVMGKWRKYGAWTLVDVSPGT